MKRCQNNILNKYANDSRKSRTLCPEVENIFDFYARVNVKVNNP